MDLVRPEIDRRSFLKAAAPGKTEINRRPDRESAKRKALDESG
jgi:hypothetical protein